MATHAIYFLDTKGKILIFRNYRGDLPQNITQRFMNLLIEEDEVGVKPILQDDEFSYFYIKYNNLILMSVTEQNANAAMVIMFLYQVVQVFTEYFKKLEEESLRDNFVVVYELLDEMMDWGYPQVTEGKVLKSFITQEYHFLDKKTHEVTVPEAATGAVSWRDKNIKYSKNQVYLDIIEYINLLVGSNGSLLRSEIIGQIKMKTELSGMPELKLGFNDKIQFEGIGRLPTSSGPKKAIEMEHVNFHQCVKLNAFESERLISFTPPDGVFDLMSYRLNTNVKPLIWVDAIVESHKKSRVEFMVKAKSQFKARSSAQNVKIFVPVPPDASTPKFKTTQGTVEYSPQKNAIIWTIKTFPGAKEFYLRAHLGLPSISDDTEPEAKPPIKVEFDIPGLTVSGIQVKYLKIFEKSGYQALPWVRYITKSGDYLLRMA